MRTAVFTAIGLMLTGCATVPPSPTEQVMTDQHPREPLFGCDTLSREGVDQTIAAQFRVCTRGNCTEESTMSFGTTMPELAIVGKWSTAHVIFDLPDGQQTTHFLTKLGPWEVAPGVSTTRFMFSFIPRVNAQADMRALIIAYARVGEARERTIRGCAPITLRPAGEETH